MASVKEYVTKLDKNTLGSKTYERTNIVANPNLIPKSAKLNVKN